MCCSYFTATGSSHGSSRVIRNIMIRNMIKLTSPAVRINSISSSIRNQYPIACITRMMRPMKQLLVTEHSTTSDHKLPSGSSPPLGTTTSRRMMCYLTRRLRLGTRHPSLKHVMTLGRCSRYAINPYTSSLSCTNDFFTAAYNWSEQIWLI